MLYDIKKKKKEIKERMTKKSRNLHKEYVTYFVGPSKVNNESYFVLSIFIKKNKQVILNKNRESHISPIALRTDRQSRT